MLSNKTNLLEEADRLAVQSALSSSTIDSSDNSLLQDQVDSIEETIIYLNTSMVSRNLNVINRRYQPIISTYVNDPNRINLPSPRSQWLKLNEKKEISATGGVVRADLFYWDRLPVKYDPIEPIRSISN